MSTLNKFEDGQWQAISSTDASLITSNSSVLREYLGLESTEIPDTEKVMEALVEDAKILKGNVSWLALHGGGGSGGGSGGGNAQADGDIYVNNDTRTGSVITRRDSDPVTFTVKAGQSGINYEWNYTVSFAGTLLKSGKITTNNTVTIVTANQTLPYINGQGKLTIVCTSGIKSIYWEGTILQSLINIEAKVSNPSIDVNNLQNEFINIAYSSTVLGDYVISINNDLLTYDVKIEDITMVYNKLVKVDLVYGLDNVGSNTTSISIKNKITGEAASTSIEVVIVSNTIVISSNTLSKDNNNPTPVILGASIPLQFTAYLSNGSVFNYTIKIGGVKVIDKENVRFGELQLDYVTSTEYEVGQTYQIEITASAANQSPVTAYYYISIAESSTLSVKTPATSYLLSDFKAYNSMELVSSCSDYIWDESPGQVTQRINIQNPNILSGIQLLEKTPPYFRLSNKAYGMLSDFNIKGLNITLENVVSIKGNLSISVCFKSDYHTDDNRTILVLGDYAINGDLYVFSKGIEVTVHEVKVFGESSTLNLPLQDSEITNLDIVYNDTSKLVKVYIDGVITGSLNNINLSKIILELSYPNIYLGCSVGLTGCFNFADVQYYRLMIYSKALTDYEILLNFLQNLAYTNFTDLGLPDGSLISEGFRRNFINYNSNTGEISQSYLWDETSKGYSVSNLVLTTNVDGNISTGINPSISLYTIPLPILFIDLSPFDAWTWKNFTSKDQSDIQTLKSSPAYGAIFNYYDPTGSNTNILKGSCAVSIQGTSTLNDIIKNLDFSINWSPDSATKTVFIPKKNWCPEDKYTLKADIVDSSHSSNASIGRFINEVLADVEGTTAAWYPPHSGALSLFRAEDSFYSKSQTVNYKPTMKVAVEGFPVFVIINFHKTLTDDNSVHTLGLYQFILGRDSAHNLGMKSLKGITDSSGSDISVDSIPYYKEGCRIEEFDTESLWIEAKTTISMPVTDEYPNGVDLITADLGSAQLTAALWLYDVNTINSLYEVKYGTASNAGDITNFVDLVRNIAQAPFRVYSNFSTVDNTLKSTDYSSGYPLYTTSDGQNWTAIKDSSGNSVKVPLVNNTDALSDLAELLDITSAYKYATVALLFGLVDNFCKNMPFISFAGDKQFKIGFYDMDTAFGITNQGDLGVSSYLYMKGLRNDENHLIEEYYSGASDFVAVAGKDNKLFLSLESGPVMAVDQNVSATTSNSYSKYWILLRNLLYSMYKDEYSTFADYFVEKFFKPQTEGCGELLFNLTYLVKYLDTETYSKLHGRRISQVRQWLKEHVKFLDSIILWKSYPDSLSVSDEETVKTVAITSFDTYDTIDAITNTPLLITTTNQGGLYKYVTFCPKNVPTEIIYGGKTTTPSVSKTISYSDNLLVLGNSEKPFGKSGFQKINNGTLLGFNDLNLSECNTFSQDNTSPINFTSVFYKNGSELRSIDLSNTSNASNLNLQLEGFTKLTDIDISNGCVSTITLPKTPLVSLNVINSTITNYTLESQALLESADVLGCNYLTSLQVTNCEKMSSIDNVNSLPNLKTVTIAGCPNITNLVITNCPNLTQISISLNQLTSLEITDCPNLTSLTISGCSNTLVNLDLSGCSTLGSINFDDFDYIALTTINLTNTSVSTAKWGTTLYSDYLDLFKMPNLESITIQTNTAVKAIQFANLGIPIPLKTPFTGCSNLERVYGNVSVNCSLCFYNLSKFSIHGSDISTLRWKGKSVLDGTRIQMPYEVLGLEDPTSVTSDNLMQTGRLVTNMSFTAAQYTFYRTNYTLFDVYYALSNLGVTKNCANMFRNGLNATYGSFDETKGNSPNRYMFAKCLEVTSFDALFWDCGRNTIKIYSPDVSGEEVIKDNGLFSPLINITNINNIFGSYHVVLDRFVLRRKEGNYKITTMSRFYMAVIMEDVNTGVIPSTSSLAAASPELYGNLSNFFENLPNLTDTSNGGILGIAGLCSASLFINYERTTNFKIPSNVKSCRCILNSGLGSGNIVLEDLFATPGNVKYIYNSFRLTSTPTLTDPYCTFEITDTILEKFTSLVSLGYLYDTTNGLSGSATNSSLCGNGLIKIIKQETFPFDIFNSCKNTITHVSGLFENSSMQEDNLYDILNNPLELPGRLFLNTPNITLVSGLFRNFKSPFKLTSNGFANCPKLLYCEYLFAGCGNNIFGPIPKKLFYHGKLTTTVTRTGTNTEPIKDGESGEWIVLDVETISFTYDLPNANIVKLGHCFESAYNLEYYLYETQEDDIERNPEYYPYMYVQNAVGDWVVNNAYNNYEYTYKWTYDGFNIPNTEKNVDNPDDGYAIKSDNIVWDEDGKYSVVAPAIPGNSVSGNPNDTMYFFCAPDLLRYCSNTQSLEIFYLFYNSGVLYYNNISASTIYSRGPIGRIPPYLLKLVPEVTNISYMFYGCRALSGYQIKLSEGITKSYLVPRDFFKYAPKINNLEGTFAGMRFASDIDLDVFGSINSGNTLNLRKIFVCPTFAVGAKVSNIFSRYNVSRTDYAFAVRDVTLSDAVHLETDMSVTFSNVFKNYSTSSYNTNTNYSYTFAWYKKGSVTHENPKTLTNNITTKNYIYSNGTIP